VTPDLLLQQSPALLLVPLVLLGLVVGSFLNVVILRLPVIMQQQWQRDCRELLELGDAEADGEAEQLGIALPASRCPHCKAPIRPWQNIPVVSYLFLRGRCANCAAPIGLRYPAVELLSAVLTVIVGLHCSSWVELAALLGLSWSLLALAVIDIDTQLLPDDITLPLLWAGLLYHLFFGDVAISDAVLGAAGGYLLLWSVYWLFRLLTGKEGMGFGDFKLLAALGAWLGWQSLPLIILLSSVVGASLGIAQVILRGRDHRQPMPFGPYLAAAGWIVLIWQVPLGRLIGLVPA
jgi:leader peptidase (prepilin peptidase)/N-methyltransferase